MKERRKEIRLARTFSSSSYIFIIKETFLAWALACLLTCMHDTQSALSLSLTLAIESAVRTVFAAASARGGQTGKQRALSLAHSFAAAACTVPRGKEKEGMPYALLAHQLAE